MRYGIILCSIGLLVAGAVYAEDTGTENSNDKSTVNTPFRLINYLRLNTEDLGGIDISEKEYPKYEINSFAMINLNVKEYVGNVYNLIDKMKPTSYIIRAQVRRAETPDWQELIVISSFTRILSKKRKTSTMTAPNGLTNPSTRVAADDTTDESSFEPYELTKEFFELTPYFNEGMPVTVLNGGFPELYKEVVINENIEKHIYDKERYIAKIKSGKTFLEKSKTVFSFNAANCYIRDVNGKPTYFEAKEGDRLRIQIFRVEPLLTCREGDEGQIPYLESEMYFTFREYGWFIHVSPGAFYMADFNRRNFNAQNFDLTTNGPGGGFNLYFSYTGTSGFNNVLINYVLPSVSVAVVGYRDKEKIVGAGTAKESTIKKVNESKFSAGLAWPVIPMPKLRDLINVSVLLYDLDFDHVLVGFSISAKLDIQALFNRSENPKVMK